MRNLILLFSTLFLFSCQSEEINQDESKSIDEIIIEMKALANTNGEILRFEIETKNEGYINKNVKTLSGFVEEFAFEFENYQERSPGTVIVECHFEDGTSTSTTCPPGSGQGSCVGSATINCMLEGGCATSCMQKTVITIIPESDRK